MVDVLDEDLIKYFWLFILFVVDILLIWFYFFIIKKLKPLALLKDNMIRLSKGDFKISTKIEGKDEIAQVANEFDKALKQLRELRDSRNLFLRNIMHELKTPITKGKLITDMYDDCERKFILIRVFQRLEYLLGEFTKIEEFTSGKMVLTKKSIYVIESIEQAFDILLLDMNDIDIENNFDLKLNIDFELFSIALKNLIDNSIKYNTNGNPKVFYVLSVDVGRKRDKSAFEIFKVIPKEDHFEKHLVNILIFHKMSLQAQARKIREMDETFNFEIIAVDANGLILIVPYISNSISKSL